MTKGLCWHCDEKWHHGHQCKQKRILMIEPIENSEEEDDFDEGETQDNINKVQDDSMEISVHVLEGLQTPQIMKFAWCNLLGLNLMKVEGATAEGGRTPCIWDTFAHEGRTEDKRTGDIAADQYHKYKEDVKLMHDMGLDAYRFSISWSRMVEGQLIQKGEDFTAYADVCFREFGDRVKYWITVNEPNIEPILGHDLGIFPPNHCSSSLASSLGLNCSKGNSSVEPYVAGHNLLFSHASAVSLYRKKY
ncbi:hypothetical protein ZIOFF_007472 [Zingiber officinale]|uniref:Beta-glucosidase n=1 Tax=Zingiber officinale TaxID=94328 RepID=A0A8J5HX88_ZINOF|nr:hypothetical protein ZIOFF_007472 [Zingiber officinale]